MESFALKHKPTLNSASVVLFVLSYVVCGIFGWLDVIMDLFNVNSSNIGEKLIMPITYSIVCFVFFALLIALEVFGLLLKNKLMVFLSLGYSVLFMISFALLGVFATGNVESVTLFKILTYVLSFMMIPVYGVIWHLGPIFLLFFAFLIIFGIVSAVKVCKKPKTTKK